MIILLRCITEFALLCVRVSSCLSVLRCRGEKKLLVCSCGCCCFVVLFFCGVFFVVSSCFCGLF